MTSFAIPPPSGQRRLPQFYDDDDAPTTSAEGHAAHFLTRTLRCEGADLDRAMRLYHHSDIVRRLVPELMAFFPDCGRAAIPLRETVPTPHVIITREGRFVTCLAEGMVVHNLPVLPYARFAAPMDEADAAIEKSRRRRQQLEELPWSRLFSALDDGPGHVTREMAQIILRDPETYSVPVVKLFFITFKYLCRTWTLTGRANRSTRQTEIRIAKNAATFRMCTYLMAAMHESFVLDILSGLAPFEMGFEVELLTAISRHPEGGDRLLKLAESPDTDERPRKICPMLLFTHAMFYPNTAHEVARRFQQLPLLMDGWEMVRLMLDPMLLATPKRIAEIGAYLRTKMPPLKPRAPHWIFGEGELFHDSYWPRPASDYFPPAAIADRVRAAWDDHLRCVKEWEGFKATQGPWVRPAPRVGRNDPCPCGSGRKHKHCCLGKRPEAPDPHEEARRRQAERERWVEQMRTRAKDREEAVASEGG